MQFDELISENLIHLFYLACMSPITIMNGSKGNIPKNKNGGTFCCITLLCKACGWSRDYVRNWEGRQTSVCSC